MFGPRAPGGRPARLAALLSTIALGLAGCSSGPGFAGAGTSVVAGFYPLQFVAEQVGGGDITVTTLAKPGAEPHDLELSPSQVRQIADADVVLHLAGFQPDVDEAVAQQASKRAFDAAAVEPLLTGSAGHDHDAPSPEPGGAKDPHLWLDPIRLAKVADALAERLAGVDPPHAADYRGRAGTLRAKLTALDGEFAAGLKNCQRREIITSHAAFGYLADRYDLAQIGLTGLTPEDEPTPQRLAAVAAEAKEHHATTIFFETLVSPKVAEAIARQVGAGTAVLDPLEGLVPDSGADYFSIMRGNLGALRTALGCS